MSNGDHTLELVRTENGHVIDDMRRRLAAGKCDTSGCISGFERIFTLIELLFEALYAHKPLEPKSPVYVPKSFREAFLIAITKSPWAVAAMLGIAALYSMFFNKIIPLPWVM